MYSCPAILRKNHSLFRTLHIRPFPHGLNARSFSKMHRLTGALVATQILPFIDHSIVFRRDITPCEFCPRQYKSR